MKWNFEKVKEYIENNEEELLSTEYINSRTKLEIKCKFGHVYHPTFSNYKNRNTRCPECAKKNRSLSYEYVSEYISNCGDELISSYKNSYSKITIRCSKNHKYETTFNRYKYGKRCPYCYQELLQTKVDNAIRDFEENGYKLISDYNKIGDYAHVECPNGHISFMKYMDFKNGHRCKFCVGNNLKYTLDDIRSYLESFGYKLLATDYINNKTPIDMECPNGHKFQMRFDVFKRGIRCPQCNCSSGEAEIMRILNDNNIKNNFQHTFDNCIDKKELPFDFYVNDKNTCIEFDGEQHYRPVDWFGGQKAFDLCKKHDEIKNQYCENNKINLIRIPYWEFNNIEQILRNEQII